MIQLVIFYIIFDTFVILKLIIITLVTIIKSDFKHKLKYTNFEVCYT